MEEQNLNEKLTSLLQEIIAETKNGSLQWQRIRKVEGLAAPDEDVTIVFLSEFKNKTLRLFHYRLKVYYDDEKYSWDEAVALQIVDRDGTAIWEFPSMTELWRLFEAVRFKVGGVEELLALSG